MSSYYWGTQQTPSIIRILIWMTSILTLTTGAAQQVFSQLLNMKGPIDVLGLSWYGIHHYLFWQPVTYLFVQDTLDQGIQLTYLLTLLFNMYILWLIGCMVHERAGTKHTLNIYFFVGVLAGLTALFVMPLIGTYSLLTGPTAALLGLCVVWTMFYPENELMLFFLFPIKSKWLMTGALGALLLLNLSQLNFIAVIFYLAAVLYGYLYGVLVLHQRGPFQFMLPFDTKMFELSQWIQRKLYKTKATESKIVDFQSGEPRISDDVFVDNMLSKITKHGEGSLSRSEKRRMDEISARKAKERSEK